MTTLAILANPTGTDPGAGTGGGDTGADPTGGTGIILAGLQDPSVWQHIGMSYTSPDGEDTFDFRGPGIYALMEEIIGLGHPQAEHFSSETPSRGGSRWRGYKVKARDVVWPLLVHAPDGSQQWQDLNEKFFRALKFDAEGTWTVTRVGGETRTLKVRLVDAEGGYTFDPIFSGHANYGIRMIAMDQPMWQGAEQRRRFLAAQTGGQLPGPGLPIGSATSIAAATIDNPGDVPAYSTWTVFGPSTSAQVGVVIDGVARVIPIPFVLADGDYVTIDTRTQSARDNTGAIRRLGQASKFSPIPAGTSADLVLTMNGAGRIECSLIPLYWRAF